MSTFVDAEGAGMALVNSMTSLVGAGNPLPKGAHLHPLHGDQQAFAQVQLISGSAELSAENPDHRAGLSYLVTGRTREAAAVAATALANALQALNGRPATAGDDATCLVADNVSGPVWAPDGGTARFLVNCDLYFRAA